MSNAKTCCSLSPAIFSSILQYPSFHLSLGSNFRKAQLAWVSPPAGGKNQYLPSFVFPSLPPVSVPASSDHLTGFVYTPSLFQKQQVCLPPFPQFPPPLTHFHLLSLFLVTPHHSPTSLPFLSQGFSQQATHTLPHTLHHNSSNKKSSVHFNIALTPELEFTNACSPHRNEDSAGMRIQATDAQNSSHPITRANVTPTS